MGELGDDFAGLTFDDFKELMLGACVRACARSSKFGTRAPRRACARSPCLRGRARNSRPAHAHPTMRAQAHAHSHAGQKQNRAEMMSEKGLRKLFNEIDRDGGAR
jgi:hypothetical protein